MEDIVRETLSGSGDTHTMPNRGEIQREKAKPVISLHEGRQSEHHTSPLHGCPFS
jgi:hypothetical protein